MSITRVRPTLKRQRELEAQVQDLEGKLAAQLDAADAGSDVSHETAAALKDARGQVEEASQRIREPGVA